MIKVKKRKILLLPGDGIGPEVIGEVRKIINWFNDKKSLDFEIDEDLAGGCSSVNFRGIMAPKGTSPEIIEYLAAKVPLMFNDKKTLKQMKKGGSPVRIMNRAEVQEMWKARKVSLTKLLAGLKP